MSTAGSTVGKCSGLHTTTLDDAEDRKQQRRNRVRIKLEDTKQRALGIITEALPVIRDNPEISRLSSKQIQRSKERLNKLVSDGYQLVTGVLVAGGAREVSRRQIETDARKASSDKIEAEVNAAFERFDEIMRKWINLEQKGEDVPQEVHSLIKQQKIACDEMIEEKNKLISDFEEELKVKDELFVKHLKKEADDVDLLVERMEEQARSLVKAFREELDEIEKSFVRERHILIEAQTSAIENATEARSHKEAHYLEIREKTLDENDKKVRHIRIRNSEELIEIKVKLETDIQHLQQQIQQMKATFQLNAEKLEYNFQVLKKRDEENMVIISQQKRKLTRLQDTLNNLRMKLTKQEKQNKEEIEYLMCEYKKNIDQYKDLQKKFNHFQLIDAKRFYNIWQMNEDKVRMVADNVSHMDELIHQQQLGLDWQSQTQPQSPLQPILTKLDRDASDATLYASQIISDTGENKNEEVITSATECMSFSTCVVRQILELIAEECDFLLESKLAHLLSPLDKEEQILMKLDTVFKALKITTENDVKELITFFVKASNAITDSSVSIVHPNEVPSVLKHFAEAHSSPIPSSSEKTSHFKVHVLGLHGSGMTVTLLQSPFWSTMASLFPNKHEKLWQALLNGMETYHHALMTRSKLINDTETVRQQNNELRLLLHQYMHSHINKELEVPPMLMMPSS